MPTEFFVNGIVSLMLTFVNVICIFTTAIIVLKIKEVAAPYTSSPDLRRYSTVITMIVVYICNKDSYFILFAHCMLSHAIGVF